MYLIWFRALSFQLKKEILNDCDSWWTKKKNTKKKSKPRAGSQSSEWAEFPSKFLCFKVKD